MRRRPEDLRQLLDVVELGTKAARRQRFSDGIAEKSVGVLLRITAQRGVLLGDAGSLRSEEHEPVVARMLESEFHVRPSDSAQPLDRIVYPFNATERLAESAEVLVAELLKQRLLVLEMRVDDGCRVIDALGDGAHGDCVDAIGGEHLARGVEDQRPHLRPFPFLAFLSLFDAHPSNPLTLLANLPGLWNLSRAGHATQPNDTPNRSEQLAKHLERAAGELHHLTQRLHLVC